MSKTIQNLEKYLENEKYALKIKIEVLNASEKEINQSLERILEISQMIIELKNKL